MVTVTTTTKRKSPAKRPASSRKPARRRPGGARGRRGPSALSRLRAALARSIGRQADDVWGVALLVAGLLAALGIYADLAGPAGGALGKVAGLLLGWGRFLLPPALAWVGLTLVQGRPRAEPGRAVVGAGLAVVACSGLGHLLGGGARRGPGEDEDGDHGHADEDLSLIHI